MYADAFNTLRQQKTITYCNKMKKSNKCFSETYCCEMRCINILYEFKILIIDSLYKMTTKIAWLRNKNFCKSICGLLYLINIHENMFEIWFQKHEKRKTFKQLLLSVNLTTTKIYKGLNHAFHIKIK